MIIRICVGSSCHLKGSEEIVGLLQKEIGERGLDGRITLAGQFCSGNCNRIGVTVQVDDEVYTGITPEHFHEFFTEKVLSKIKEK